MEKQDLIAGFDPNEPALNNGLFGLPFDAEQSDIHVLPAPWEVTVSYGSGTAAGPEEILNASAQVDLYDAKYPKGWRQGVFMLEEDERWRKTGEGLRELALEYLHALEIDEVGAEEEKSLDQINDKCTAFHLWVEKRIGQILVQGKKAVLLGGDHSTSLGAIRAHKAKFGDFGILQIDAHADLRPAYEGFTYSHASIMYNVLKEQLATRLTIVGLRDYCHQEADLIESDPRIHAFTDQEVKAARFEGKNWADQVAEIIATLPQKVYLSFDIDGLNPSLCPNTGTPVPGGMELEEAVYLIDAVKASGRTLIGMDLVEVSPGEDEWDANVGARALYTLSNRLS